MECLFYALIRILWSSWRNKAPGAAVLQCRTITTDFKEAIRAAETIGQGDDERISMRTGGALRQKEATRRVGVRRLFSIGHDRE